MDTTNIKMSAAILCRTTDAQFCPECGRIMRDADRLQENDALYIWYKCSGEYCDGTWLRAIPSSLSRSSAVLDE